MNSENHPQNFVPSPEEDMAIFYQEMKQKKYSHALFHLACAISSDPECKEWISQADAVWNLKKEQIFSYFETEQSQYYAVVALKAYFLWKSGETQDAISTLVQVIRAIPNAYYFPWIAEWLFTAQDAISPSIIVLIISGCMNQMDFYANNHDNTIYEKLVEFLEPLTQEEASNLPIDKYVMTSMLYRRLKRYDKALSEAKKGFEQSPTAINANFVALCYKEMDELDEMEKYTQLSISINPSERSICNDMGDVFLLHENYAKAAQYYALAMEAGEDEWAEPSYYYSRYLLNGEESDKMFEQLIQYSKKYNENSRAKELLDKIYDKLYPEESLFYDQIPFSQEALTNLLYQFSTNNAEKLGSDLHSLTVPIPDSDTKSMRTAVSCLESPSAIRAICLYLSNYDQNPINWQLICHKEPDPPFLEPVKDANTAKPFRLWNYDKSYSFTPNVKPPNEKVKERVFHLAATAYSLPAWYEQAQELALELTQADRDSLEGVMVFPPNLSNKDYQMDQWLMRVKYAAVFLLAALDEREEQIPSASLKQILLGQLDCPVLAALTLLSYQTIQYPECFHEVYQLFCDFEDRIFNDSYCFFLTTYLVSILHLNGLEEEKKEYYQNWLYSILSKEEDDIQQNDEEIEKVKKMLDS